MSLPDAPLTVNAASWPPLPQSVPLAPNEVHVVMALRDIPTSHVRGLERLLHEDERNRAERFYFERDRRRYIVARARLRTILGRYLQLEPSHVGFSYTPQGKPTLATDHHRDELQFNVSHSDGIALYAVTRSRAIGIDLERVHKSGENLRIAEWFFSDQEIATLRALPPRLQDHAFFACWTRKEAYLKAKGTGLSPGLRDFDVSLIPGEPASLLANRRGDAGETARWSLRELIPGPDYIAALAVEGHGWRLKCWRWQE